MLTRSLSQLSSRLGPGLVWHSSSQCTTCGSHDVYLIERDDDSLVQVGCCACGSHAYELAPKGSTPKSQGIFH